MEKITYNPNIDNIFEYSFMNDFTTVILAKEEYNIDISKLNYVDEDDFYSLKEKKPYTFEQLAKKFNIHLLINKY